MMQPHAKFISRAFNRRRTAPLPLDRIAVKHRENDVGIPGINRQQHDVSSPRYRPVLFML